MSDASATTSPPVATTPGRIPPGPKGHWFWGSLQERRRDGLSMFVRGMQEYGGIVHYRMWIRHVYLVSAPEGVKHVLVDHTAKYSKGFGIKKLGSLLLGEGLLTSEGEL